jgi:hypothetical protein
MTYNKDIFSLPQRWGAFRDMVSPRRPQCVTLPRRAFILKCDDDSFELVLRKIHVSVASVRLIHSTSSEAIESRTVFFFETNVGDVQLVSTQNLFEAACVTPEEDFDDEVSGSPPKLWIRARVVNGATFELDTVIAELPLLPSSHLSLENAELFLAAREEDAFSALREVIGNVVDSFYKVKE